MQPARAGRSAKPFFFSITSTHGPLELLKRAYPGPWAGLHHAGQRRPRLQVGRRLGLVGDVRLARVPVIGDRDERVRTDRLFMDARRADTCQ